MAAPDPLWQKYKRDLHDTLLHHAMSTEIISPFLALRFSERCVSASVHSGAQEEDIISVDIGVVKKGYHGDHAYTFAIGIPGAAISQ